MTNIEILEKLSLETTKEGVLSKDFLLLFNQGKNENILSDEFRRQFLIDFEPRVIEEFGNKQYRAGFLLSLMNGAIKELDI